MIGTNLFMAVCMWIFLPIVYVSMWNNTVCKKNLILSVTLPPEAKDDPEVAAYCEAFKKRLRRCCVILTAALVPAIFLPRVSVSLTWSMTWLIIAMYSIMRTYGKAYGGLRQLKRRRGWVIPTAPQVVAEPRPVKRPKPVKTGRFVPPMILSVLPVISCFVDQWNSAWSHILALTAGCNLFVTTMSLVCYGLIFRQKPEVLDGDPELTEVLTGMRRHNWTKMWLLITWLTALYSLAVWLCQGNMTTYIVCTLIYAFLLTAAALVTEFSTRRAQQRLTGDSRRMPIVDEDDCWIWGQFYYNPNSPRAMINERVGMGMNMNFAHPAGKAMAVFTVLVLLAMPALGVWLMAEELTEPAYTLTEAQLTVRQASSSYTIELDEITGVELLDTLPDTSRTWGTGLPNLLKGRFFVEGYGSCTLCLDPTDPPFLLIETERGTYILGAENAEELYHALQ